MKAITGVMLIIICSMIPSFIILPKGDLSLSIIPLHSNWQIPGLLLTSLICGPKIATISAISYIIIGLFYLPVFHGGGSVGYILTNEFGYLLGFIPAAWTCGYLVKKNQNENLINFTAYTAISLAVIHCTGITYLVLSKIFGNLINNLSDLILVNTFILLPNQLLLCISISLLALLFKKIILLR
tara:strand:+ start:863 stop:1414 length:552 start_codon:yes stop_codon:yes gene_type:complete